VITDIQQATIADMQEKREEIHELIRREDKFMMQLQADSEGYRENAIKIGDDLNWFKEQPHSHGNLIPWIESEFHKSRWWAQDRMRLAAYAKANGGHVPHLGGMGALFELVTPSMPATVIEMVETKQIPPTVKAIREAKRNVDNIPLDVPHISSKNNEWYTPAKYVDAARELMGGIELDPASCKQANETVKAARYYDISENGFDKPWEGKVWLNPPYGYSSGKSNQEVWSARLIEQYTAGITTEAVLLVNAAVDTKWYHRLFQYSEREPHFFPVCFPDHRVNFSTPEPSSSGSTHGSAFIYLGTQTRKFFLIFSQFGLVMKRVIFDESEW
jgi:hypothetical protein